MRLFSSGIGLYLFGIRLTHHCSPHASHPFNPVSHWLTVLAVWDNCHLSFRIAIWNRNILVSFIAVGTWLVSVALNIRRMSRIHTCPHYHLISLACTCEDLTLVRRFTIVLVVHTNAHANLNKIDTVYNPIANACALLHTDDGLVNGIGILVADAVLLLAMLIGLLRHPARSSTGMWKFLYQQVMHVHFLRPTRDADFQLVYDLDIIGHGCGDTSCGLSHFRCLMTFSSLLSYVGLPCTEF